MRSHYTLCSRGQEWSGARARGGENVRSQTESWSRNENVSATPYVVLRGIWRLGQLKSNNQAATAPTPLALMLDSLHNNIILHFNPISRFDYSNMHACSDYLCSSSSISKTIIHCSVSTQVECLSPMHNQF